MRTGWIWLAMVMVVCMNIDATGAAGRAGWREKLFERLEQSGEDKGGFLCYFLKSKLSYGRGSTKAFRDKQLIDIRKECGTRWIPEPVRSSLSSSSSSGTKHVVLYTHNGFGNQLYQIAFGYMMAQSLGRVFHVGESLPGYLYNPLNKNSLDPNTWEGTQAGKALLNFDRVDENWMTGTCGTSNITMSDRRSDKNWWGGGFRKIVDVVGWLQFFDAPDDSEGGPDATSPASGMRTAVVETPTCLVMIGYWLNTQWFDPFLQPLTSMMKTAMPTLPRFKLDPQAIVVHMRCGEPHYMTPPKVYYDVILSNTTYSDLWIAAAPRCTSRKTYRYLVHAKGAKPFPTPTQHAGLFEGELAYLSGIVAGLCAMYSVHTLCLGRICDPI